MSSAIVTQNLSIQFGNYLALENLSLSIPEGSFVAIVGPNGSGKSTFLKSLLNLVEPTSGSIKLYGKTPAEISPEWVGYVPQVKTLDRSFPAISLDLVVTGINRQWPGLASKQDKEKALQALARVGAEHLANRPLGRLSGGELQRVYLARSFVRRPKLVLLDEPATGIDAVGEDDMHHMLGKYYQETGATILMVTHDWGAAYYHASQVLILNRVCIAFGKPEEALAEKNMRRAFGHMGHGHTMGVEIHDV